MGYNTESGNKEDIKSPPSLKMLLTIIELLPKEYSDIIEYAFTCKRVPKEYMLSAILFTISTSSGLTFYLNALGYKNYSNLYFAIIGSRGDAKSEAIKMATKPLKDLDDLDYKKYRDLNEGNAEDFTNKPKRKQLLLQNASIEAAHKIHADNPNSIGISIDEIFALIEKMGNSNSRDGTAWRNFLLESYTNGHVDISRKTTESFRIKESCTTLLGGLQHQFLPQLFANGNLESGFIDRLLFTPKLTTNCRVSRESIPLAIIDAYSESVYNILDYKRQCEKEDEIIKQFQLDISEGASELLFNYTQNLVKQQEHAAPILKEYMSKMQISIQKLSVVIHIMTNATSSNFRSVVNKNTVDLAILLNEFYFKNFEEILLKNFKQKSSQTLSQQIIEMAKKNGASQKSVAEVMGVNKSTISRNWNKNKNMQLAT